MANVNAFLARMRQAGKLRDMKRKGGYGEEAALAVLDGYRKKTGGLIYRSFSYPYASNSNRAVYLGNIFRAPDGGCKDVTGQFNDEIDILLVTKFRVFPVEVKSYHAALEVYDHWVRYNGDEAEKSPVAQAEKHARHLYHTLYEYLPDGNPNYIRPIVCFVDRCTVTDSRSQKFKAYIPVTILNNLGKALAANDTPPNAALDLEAIKRRLDNVRR
jgi:hypothetical protein